MKILYFHQYFSIREGSTGTRSYEMAKKLIERGHEVTMVCSDYGVNNTGIKKNYTNSKRKDVVSGINVIQYNYKSANKQNFFFRTIAFFRFSLSGIKLCLKEDYDLVFCSSTPLTAAIPGIFSKIFKNKYFIFEVRDLWPALPKAMGVIRNPILLFLMESLEKKAYKKADHIIALSTGMQNGIISKNISSKKITVIPNGCDLDLFTKANAGDYLLPEKIDNNDFIILFSGAHGIANNLDTVLSVAKILIQRGRTDIKFLLVGDGIEKEKLKKRVNLEKIQNVIFKNPISKTDLAKLMNRCDLGLQVLANIEEFYNGTSPNKFFDYISSGLPVINNYPGWVAEIIKEKNCGFVVEPESIISFADTIEYAADNIQELNQKGKNARRVAENMFDRKIQAKKFVNLIESFL